MVEATPRFGTPSHPFEYSRSSRKQEDEEKRPPPKKRTMRPTRFRHEFSLLIILITSAVSLAQGNAQDKMQARLQDPVFMCWISDDDVKTCVSCHLLPNVFVNNNFCRMSEMEKWLVSDKHTIARIRVEPFLTNQTRQGLNALRGRVRRQQQQTIMNLKANDPSIDTSRVGMAAVPIDWIGESNILSRTICDKIWGKNSVNTKSGYVKFRDHCLTCHGGYQSGDSGFELGDDKAQLGIDCLRCHQKGNNREWIVKHYGGPEKEWRLQQPDAKEAAGMRHLVDISTQADLCFDCHIGNRSKNMFVTHEMYAAGHPPLPSIELETFCKEMPQHWQTPLELFESLKTENGQRYFETNYPETVKQTNPANIYWNTRKMLVGALAARKKNLELFMDSADLAQSGNTAAWADYSLYDCSACHHELRTDSERQRRSYPGPPGRPRPSEWPQTLLEVAFEQGRQQTIRQVKDLEQQLTRRFADVPFGDPIQVRQDASELREVLIRLTEEVEQRPIGLQDSVSVLRGLANRRQDDFFTYDGARQLVWAIQTVAKEFDSRGKKLSPRIAALISSLDDPEIVQIDSKLPSGRNQFIYPESLEADLKRRATFDPTHLQSQLEQLHQKLPSTGSNSAARP